MRASVRRPQMLILRIAQALVLAVCLTFVVTVRFDGRRVVASDIVWTTLTPPAINYWEAITYGAPTTGDGRFVAVASSGTGNRVMTSPDGVNWTSQSSPDRGWKSVTFGNGVFVAVGYDVTPSIAGRVMTSPDGITWTQRTPSSNRRWTSVTYGNGQFVAVSDVYDDNQYYGLTLAGAVMTSPDGITWTGRTAPEYSHWASVAYGEPSGSGSGIFVAVANNGIGNLVMSSTDGITWTLRSNFTSQQWRSVTYGGGLFVAVAATGTSNRVATSPDGINWTRQTTAPDRQWDSVTFGNGVFAAVGIDSGGYPVMTSPDGITWASQSAPNNGWTSVAFGGEVFVAVGWSGTQRVLTGSPPTPVSVTASSSSVTAGDAVSSSVSVSSGVLLSGDAVGSATFTYEGTGGTSYGPSTTAPTAVGTYSVTPSALTLSSGDISNYQVTYVAGTLTITSAPLVPTSSTTAPATTTTTVAATTGLAGATTVPAAVLSGAPDGAVLFGGVGPELEPGAGEILEGDSWDEVSSRSSEVGSELVRDENEVVLQPVNSDGSPVTDDDFEIRLSGECSGADCSIETVNDADGASREVMRLQTVDGVARATGSGFQPGTEVKLWLFSDPTSLGTATVAPDGTFAVDVPLDGVTPGEHTLQANGVTADLKARTAHVGVVLDPSSTEFPATGGSSSPIVWAVLMVSLGLIVMVARRRLDVDNHLRPQ